MAEKVHRHQSVFTVPIHRTVGSWPTL